MIWTLIVLTLCARLAHKTDLPDAHSAAEVTMLLKHLLSGRLWHVFPTTALVQVAASGIPEAFDWLETAVQISKTRGSVQTAVEIKADERAQPNQPSGTVQAVLEKCLVQAMDGKSASSLLEQFNTFCLPSWDHCTHIRLAYNILRIHGRQKGMTDMMTRSDALAHPCYHRKEHDI